MNRILVLVLVLGLGGYGCSKNPETVVNVAPTPALDTIKSELQMLADKGGPLGSGLSLIKEKAEKLKATDAAKADAISNGVDEIMKMQDANKIKAKAKEILSKL